MQPLELEKRTQALASDVQAAMERLRLSEKRAQLAKLDDELAVPETMSWPFLKFGIIQRMRKT